MRQSVQDITRDNPTRPSVISTYPDLTLAALLDLQAGTHANCSWSEVWVSIDIHGSVVFSRSDSAKSQLPDVVLMH